MLFLAALLVDGALAGAVYAPIALAFVVVYKASRMINFALGEWMMVGTRLVASGLHAGFGLLGAVGAACAGMAALAVVFNRVVLRHLAGRPVIALIMVTLGLGAFLRASGAVLFKGSPGYIRLPLPSAPLDIRGIFVPVDKLVAAGFGSMVSYVVLIAVLFVRPYGLLGKPQIERV